MAFKKKGSGGKRFLEVDFSGVESGGKAVPDGAYTVEVAEVTEEESSEGNPYLKWKLKISEGDCKGSVLYDNTSLQPQALWRLKGVLESLDVEVEDSVMKLDIGDFVDGTFDVIVVNENYEGRDRPKVSEYGKAGALTSGKSSKKSSKAKPTDDEDETEEEETKPTSKKKKSVKKDDEVEFEEGQRVKFKDDEGKLQKGTVVSTEGDTVTVEVKDEQWEIPAEDLEVL
jgi:hypothetical protein